MVFMDVMPYNFIFRLEEASALKREATGLSGMLVPSHQIHSVISQKTQFIILTVKETQNFTLFSL
jgi:hypothetical protein